MRHISDLHIHTLVSHHAYSTVRENVLQARAQGLSLIAITDHCYGAPDAGNDWHFGNMVIWPPDMEGVRVLRGVEANIMAMDGTLDTTVGDLMAVDYVIASLHAYCVAPRTLAAHTDALLRVLENPFVHTIGHPADMKFPLDLRTVARACAQAGKRLEINEHAMARAPQVEAINERLLEACAQEGTQIVLSTDAHICYEVGRCPRTDALLARTGFPESLIWNADAARVLADLKKQ